MKIIYFLIFVITKTLTSKSYYQIKIVIFSCCNLSYFIKIVRSCVIFFECTKGYLWFIVLLNFIARKRATIAKFVSDKITFITFFVFSDFFKICLFSHIQIFQLSLFFMQVSGFSKFCIICSSEFSC